MGENRIKTTHVGSLIRPDDVIAIMRRLDKGEAVDPAERQAALERGRARGRAPPEGGGGRHRQRRRVRQVLLELLRGQAPRRHRGAPAGRATRSATCRWRRPTGSASASSTRSTSRPSRTSRTPAATSRRSARSPTRAAPRSSATSPTSRRRWRPRAWRRASCPPSRRRPASRRSSTSTTARSEAALKAVAKAMGEEYKAVVDAGLNVQVDDAFIPFMYDVMVPPGTIEDWMAWGQSQDRRGEPRARRAAEGEGPLPRLLGQLERPAHERRAAARRPRSHPAGQRGHDPVRERQPAPRARVEGVGGHRPARRR